jgi:glycosyltransferase involved in cell wall biosynthesis
MPPLVSIIIPCYKQARFLAEAIESALRQDCPSKEVIVVNDGSPDDTRDVALGFREKIVYLEQENRGLSGARNAGIRASTGEYLAFLDSDDVYLPHALTSLASYLATHPDIALACGDAFLFNETGTLGLKSAQSGKPDNPVNFRWETVRYCPTPSTVMIRRSCFETAPLFEETVKEGGEDWLMWVRLSLDFNMAYLDQPLICYRLHGLNATSNTERINRGNRQAAAFAVESPRLPEYPRPFRARLLFYRFATLWRMGPRSDAARYLFRALMTDPFQTSYGAMVIRKGIASAMRRRREGPP